MQQCVILAGGFGSRMVEGGYKQPKILLQVHGKSLLEQLLEELESEGYTHALFCLGFNANFVVEELGRITSSIQIEYFIESEQKGTLGALFQVFDKLDSVFTILMGDLIMWNTNLGVLHKLFEKSSYEAQVLCKYSNHPLDSDIIELDNWTKVIHIHQPPHNRKELENAITLSGAMVVRKKALSFAQTKVSSGITSELLIPIISKGGEVQAIFHQGLIRDVGTPQRLEDYLNSNSSKRYSFSNEQVALLDRDGTLNILNGHISMRENLIISKIGQVLVDRLKSQNVKCILVTNQPVVARGEATLEEILELTSDFLCQIGFATGEVPIYLCPHHPDSGFLNEVSSLKLACICRKPHVGLLLQAATDFNFRLTNAIFFGDSISDMQAAVRVGARGVHIHNNSSAGECEVERSNEIICLTSHQLELIDFFGSIE